MLLKESGQESFFLKFVYGQCNFEQPLVNDNKFINLKKKTSISEQILVHLSA